MHRLDIYGNTSLAKNITLLANRADGQHAIIVDRPLTNIKHAALKNYFDIIISINQLDIASDIIIYNNPDVLDTILDWNKWAIKENHQAIVCVGAKALAAMTRKRSRPNAYVLGYLENPKTGYSNDAVLDTNTCGVELAKLLGSKVIFSTSVQEGSIYVDESYLTNYMSAKDGYIPINLRCPNRKFFIDGLGW